MMADNHVWKWLAESIAADVAIAVCQEPGSNELHCFSRDNTNPRPATFEIGEWLQPYADRVTLYEIPEIGWIPEAYKVSEVQKTRENGESKTKDSAGTDRRKPDGRAMGREEYLQAVEEIAAGCRRRGGKTVFSRIITGENPSLDIADAARKLFAAFPDTMRFCYNIPGKGCCMGATPETLLDVNLRSGVVATMALAGTRPASEASWDDKNLRENRFVSDFIANTFRSFGIAPAVSEPYTIGYGTRLQHLRCDISGTLTNAADFPLLLDALNPTPALCGYPREDAINDIREFETYSRGCYGGFVALNRPGERFRAYVNLRSCCINPRTPHQFRIYAGGGIVGDSEAQKEWDETCGKAEALMRLLSPDKL